MSDLLDTGEAITTEIDFDITADRRRGDGVRRNADGYELGVCRVCQQEASTPNGTYCAEHKTRQTKVPGEGQSAGAPSGTQSVARPRSPRTGRGAPTGDEWSSKVFDKLVILLTALYAGSMVNRMGINDPNDAIADSLTMTNDEAHRVAKPIGRFLAGTELSKKHGRRVLENSDLLDAGFAVYDYMTRVNATLKMYAAQGPVASVTPIRTTPIPQQEEPPSGETQPPIEQPGIPRDGFPDLHGAIFVP